MTRRSALPVVVKKPEKDGTHQLIVKRLIGLLFRTLCFRLLYLIALEGSPNYVEAACKLEKKKMLTIAGIGKSVSPPHWHHRTPAAHCIVSISDEFPLAATRSILHTI